ncbi:MAG: HAD family hydrolase [Candidatus Woesearchaeota archaeon]
MVKVIVFDLWGTIVENGIFPGPTKHVLKIMRLGMPFSDFIIKFEKCFMTKEYASLSEAFIEVSKEFNKSLPEFVYGKLVGMWNTNSILAKLFPESVEVLKELKKDYTLVLLTNVDKFSYSQVSEKFQLKDYFEKSFPSFETGMLKSDPKIFDKICKSLKAKKDDLLVVGDSIESDMNSAEAAGVKAVLVDRRESREYPEKIKDLRELKKYIENLS